MSSLSVGKTSGNHWRVIETYYEQGERKYRQVPKSAYYAMGINPDWPIEEARSRIKDLNKINRIKKRQVVGAAVRVELEQRISSAFLPSDWVTEFEIFLGEMSFTPGQSEKMKFQWNFVQKMIATVCLEPRDYAMNSVKFYRYLQARKISPSYSEKIIRMLNHWGRFVARKQRSFFEAVLMLRGVELQRLRSAYNKSETYRGASAELTPATLEVIKEQLPSEEQYNWLAATVWFGLRPEEANRLVKDETSWKIELQDDIEVLWVYQAKLASIEEHQRWKPIPAIYSEQKALISKIREGALVQPLNKVLKRLTGKKISCYGGRKGFTDLMLGLGQKLEDISVWMGHRSIERTWKSYKNKQKVAFTKPTSRLKIEA